MAWRNVDRHQMDRGWRGSSGSTRISSLGRSVDIRSIRVIRGLSFVPILLVSI